MVSKITLKTSSVNSDTAVNLQASNIEYDWPVFTSVQDTPRPSPDTSFNNTLSPGRNTGFGNPTITVSGYFDLDKSHVTGASAKIDREFVEDFVLNADEIMTLKSDTFITTSNATGEKNVMIAGYSSSNPNSNITSYTLEFVEVRSA